MTELCENLMIKLEERFLWMSRESSFLRDDTSGKKMLCGW